MSSSDELVTSAILAVRAQFEKALIDEWNIPADAATVRNATNVLPNRCRQCKKPAAGVGNTCTCKTNFGYESFLSNPRDTLLGLLRMRCQSVSDSASLTAFVKQTTSIGVAGTRDLEWVEDQLEKLRPSFSLVCRTWIAGVCGGPLASAGQLPAWFEDHGVILRENLHRVLSKEDSEAELLRIESEIAPFFEETRNAALNQAAIQMAQVRRERMPRKRARQDITAAIIAKVKEDNPGLSIERICQHLDSKGCPLRETDKRQGLSSWHGAWKNLKHRNRIKRFISDIEPAASGKRV